MGRRRRAIVAVVALLIVGGCAPSRPGPARAVQPVSLADHLSGFAWPLPLTGDQELSSAFGRRGRRHHDGVDLRARHGDPIFAARAGMVRFAGTMRGYGSTAILDHGGGVSTLYAHASVLHVRAGEWVQDGQVIGAVGVTGNATGPHLHFEISWAGHVLDPIALLPRLARSSSRQAR